MVKMVKMTPRRVKAKKSVRYKKRTKRVKSKRVKTKRVKSKKKLYHAGVKCPLCRNDDPTHQFTSLSDQELESMNSCDRPECPVCYSSCNMGRLPCSHYLCNECNQQLMERNDCNQRVIGNDEDLFADSSSDEAPPSIWTGVRRSRPRFRPRGTARASSPLPLLRRDTRGQMARASSPLPLLRRDTRGQMARDSSPNLESDEDRSRSRSRSRSPPPLVFGTNESDPTMIRPVVVQGSPRSMRPETDEVILFEPEPEPELEEPPF